MKQYSKLCWISNCKKWPFYPFYCFQWCVSDSNIVVAKCFISAEKAGIYF